jgi:hypothetical protein
LGDKKLKLTFDKDTLAPQIEETPETLDMAQRGFFSGLGGAKIMGAPIGDALLGGASATLVTEVIDGFVGGGVMGALAKLVVGNMAAGMFSGVLGKNATDSARLFITYDAIRDLLPVDQWTRQIVGGVGTATGVGQSQPPVNVPYTGNGSVLAIDEWLQRAA